MPEVLKDGGVYFDPEDAGSIVSALESMIGDAASRQIMATRAFELAAEYSWERCARETWTFLRRTLDRFVPAVNETKLEAATPFKDTLQHAND